jgi:catechol 2,3-dioxygenase-like lactoylglutathione lyase family enzyme
MEISLAKRVALVTGSARGLGRDSNIKATGSERSPFSQLHHIAIVVEDIERAVKYYSSLGIGPFQSYPPLRDYVKVNVPDKDAFYNLTIRQAQVGPVALQLIQPGEGRSIYRDFLNRRGEGVFHLGFMVEDVEKEEAKLKEQGLKVLSSGRRVDGSGFTYFHTSAIAGVTLLIRQNPSK